MPKKKILAVDDEPEMLNLIQYTLEKAGFAVVVCSNGKEAFEKVKIEKPDLLILDVMLPGVDGHTLQLKFAEDEATKSIPTLILTALEPAKALFSKTKFPQVVGFMTKPFRTDELVEKVQGALGGAPTSS